MRLSTVVNVDVVDLEGDVVFLVEEEGTAFEFHRGSVRHVGSRRPSGRLGDGLVVIDPLVVDWRQHPRADTNDVVSM